MDLPTFERIMKIVVTEKFTILVKRFKSGMGAKITYVLHPFARLDAKEIFSVEEHTNYLIS